MIQSKSFFPVYFFLLMTALSLVENIYAFIVLCDFIFLFFIIIFNLGKKIIVLELTAFFIVLTCLLMPLIGYYYYPKTNDLSAIWVKFMQVSEGQYFSFILPAVNCFCLAITFPLKNNVDSGRIIFEIRKSIMTNEKIYVGIFLILIGSISSFLSFIAPSSLNFIFTLFYFSSYTGMLYLFYAKRDKRLNLIIIGFFVLVFIKSLSTGMFTELVYMGMATSSFLLLGNKAGITKKLILTFSVIFLIILLQSVKSDYRKKIWDQGFTGDKTSYFFELTLIKLSEPSFYFTKENFFPIYVRMNQGFNISLVMRRFPSKVSFDNGSELFTKIASSFIPRFLWPDKPQAGGKTNMLYYAGKNISGYSTNVGPLGEAYASFGPQGGIFYMFLIGFFIRWVYAKIFYASEKFPHLILWIPVMFYQIVYSGEADTLQIINTIVKTALYIYFINLFFPSLLSNVKVVLNKRKRRILNF